MPEPPTVFNLDAIQAPEVSAASSSVTMQGAVGAVPGNALVRVTNLDGTELPSASFAEPNGSFSIRLAATPGDELRFEWIRDGQRSPPADALYSVDGIWLQSSPRFDCLVLTPGALLDFTEAADAKLRLENRCESALTFASPRARLPLTDFTLETQLPLELASGESAELDFTFARTAAGSRENNLLVDVTLEGNTQRYAVTLLAPAEE
jgi:hypothetical protein